MVERRIRRASQDGRLVELVGATLITSASNKGESHGEWERQAEAEQAPVANGHLTCKVESGREPPQVLEQRWSKARTELRMQQKQNKI